MNKIAPLIQKMIAYNHGDAKRISHALKVHNYTKTIAILEKVNEYDLFNLENVLLFYMILELKFVRKNIIQLKENYRKKKGLQLQEKYWKTWIIKTSTGYCF